MTSFRYHVVSLVSVLLALAVGLVLGGGPLRGEADDRVGDQAGEHSAEHQTDAEVAGELSGLRRTGGFTDSFAAAVAPTVLRSTLRGRAVTVVALPTADPATVTTVVRLVRGAGGRVGGTVDIGPRLVDVTEKGLVEQLGSQLETRVPALSVPSDAGPYERIGALLGRAVGTGRRGGDALDGPAGTVLGGLRAAGLVTPGTRVTRRGDLVLVVTGAGAGSPEARKGAATIVTSLVHSVDGVTAGVVLAGPVAATGASGQVTAVRDDARAARDVSTVDTLDGTAGQVVTVLALAGQAAGRSGHYGTVDAADGAMPRMRW